MEKIKEIIPEEKKENLVIGGDFNVKIGKEESYGETTETRYAGNQRTRQ